MPRNRVSPKPPEPMTWSKATPVLVLCIIFDALRFLFDMFWFFGPAMAALACTIAGSNTTLGQIAGTTATAAVCSVAAAAAGTFGMPAIETFGAVMAMAVGLGGWLTILLVQLLNNAGIFKENFSMILRYALSLLLSEIPFVNALPSLTIINATMFNIQIKKGNKALKEWEEGQKAVQNEDRQQQAAQFMQARNVGLAQMQMQEAAETPSNVIPFPSRRTPPGGGEEIHGEERIAA